MPYDSIGTSSLVDLRLAHHPGGWGLYPGLCRFVGQGTLIKTRDLANQEQRLVELRSDLDQDLGNDELIAEVRSLDTDIRTAMFTRLDWVKRTVWCLLGAVVVLWLVPRGFMSRILPCLTLSQPVTLRPMVATYALDTSRLRGGVYSFN